MGKRRQGGGWGREVAFTVLNRQVGEGLTKKVSCCRLAIIPTENVISKLQIRELEFQD